MNKFQYRRRLFFLFSLILVFCTTYALILPAITLEGSGDDAVTLSWYSDNSSIYSINSAHTHVTVSPTVNTDTSIKASMSVNADAGNHPVGSIAIRLPLHVVKDRDGGWQQGNWVDTFECGVPEYTEGYTGTETNPFAYIADEENNQVIIWNTVPITDVFAANLTFSYHFLPTLIKDGTEGVVTADYVLDPAVSCQGEWNVGQGDAVEQRTIDFDVNTVADTYVLRKSNMGRSPTWKSTWGTQPSGTDNMYFVVYRVAVDFNLTSAGGTQPSVITLSEFPEIDGYGGRIVRWKERFAEQENNAALSSTTYGILDVDYDNSGDDEASLEAFQMYLHNDTIGYGYNPKPDFYAFDIIVAYPVDNFLVNRTFKNKVQANQTAIDMLDVIQPKQVTASFKYEKTEFNYSQGAVMYKHGVEGSSGKKAVETEFLNQSTHKDWVYTAVKDSGAITLVMNDIPAHLMYTLYTQAEGFGVEKKLVQPPSQPGGEGVYEYEVHDWTAETIDDQLYLAGELLEPGDYSIKAVEISTQNIKRWEYDDSISDYRMSQTGGGSFIQNATTVLYRTSENGAWQQAPFNRYGSYDFSEVDECGGAYQVRLQVNSDYVAVNAKYQLYIELNPTDHVKELLQEVVDGETQPKDSELITNVAAMRIFDWHGNYVPEDESSISGTLADEIVEHDQNAGYGIGQGKAMYHKLQTDELDSMYYKGSIGKTLTGYSNDALKQRIEVNYEVKPVNDILGFSVGLIDFNFAKNLLNNADARKEYADELCDRMGNVLEDLTYYDLLPKGMEVDRKSVAVTSQASGEENLLQNLEVVENWRGSGRTMLIAHIDSSKAHVGVVSGVYVASLSDSASFTVSVPVKMTYKGYYSWDSYTDYGSTLHNIVALMDNADTSVDMESGYPDNPGEAGGTHSVSASVMDATERAAFTDLNGKTDDHNNTLYAHTSNTISAETSSVSGFNKSVKGERESDYTELASTTPEGGYTYRLRIESDKQQINKDIVMYDILEEAYGVNDYWKGCFESVDVTNPVQHGVDAVVYYSTVPGLNPRRTIEERDVVTGQRPVIIGYEQVKVGQEKIKGKWVDIYEERPIWGTEDIIETREFNVPNEDADLDNADIWSTVPPQDLSTVTAVAVDLRYKAGTGPKEDYILNSGNSLIVKINMKAPDSEELADKIYPAVFAWNQARIQQNQANSSNTSIWSDIFMSDSHAVKVKAVPDTTLRIKKIDEETGESLKGAVFELTETANPSNSVTVTSKIDGSAIFEDLKLMTQYQLKETPVEGYAQAGPWSVFINNAGEFTFTGPGGSSVTKNADDFYVINNSKVHTHIVLKKTDENGRSLAGAKFALYGSDDSGNILSTPMLGYEEMESGTDGVFVSDEFSLPEGTYYLKEIEAPEGYIQLSQPVKMKVCSDKIELTGNGVSGESETVTLNQQTQQYEVSIVNEVGYELPKSGGIGTGILYMAGIVLLIAAAFLSVRRYKKCME